jgi:GT2 family glycosyltransferase
VLQATVIVPIFNGLAFLPTFFESLCAALPEGSQLILVDDASTEPVFDAVPEIPRADTTVRLRNDRNLGYSAAVNRGFRVATGDVVIQLNTDLVLHSDCISAMVDLLEREKHAGIVGSKLVFPGTGLVQHVGMAFGNHSKRHVFFELPSAHPLCQRTREVQIMTGATVAMTRRVLDLVGPLDETYFNHNEDVDHCLRALQHGLRNFVCADSVAFHWVSRSGPARFAQVSASEALFWSTWANAYEVDLGRFVEEALDHVLDDASHLEAMPFEILDLSRGADNEIIIERLSRRWPGADERVRHFRQLNNPSTRLWLPLLLPHWVVSEPVPFIYVVDKYRDLEENFLWFESRRRVVNEELVVDLTGAALRTSELPWCHG